MIVGLPYNLCCANGLPMRFLSLLVLVIALVAVPLVLAQVQGEPTQLNRYVTDNTGTLSPGESTLLDSRLRAFEDSTSNQIVVLVIPTLGDAPIEEFTLKVAEENHIGQHGKSNGVLLFVAKDDRRIRIEVGYGLEGALPDALSGQIIRREIGPKFREGDFYGGISAGVDAIMLATKGEYKAEGKSDKRASRLNVLPFIIIVVILFLIIRNMSGRRHGFLGVFGPSLFWGGPFSGGGSGGGGGGGGFGGFSGGGGSFGGGGASGGW